jgi:Tfp pilus assembly protein FimT
VETAQSGGESAGPRRPRSRGMTAVELITVVALLVILGAVAIPSLSPVVLRGRLRGAAWQLAGDLRLTRQEAITFQRRHRICLTNCAIGVEAGAYSIERDDGTRANPRWVSIKGATTRLPPTVALVTTATATFDEKGSASGGTFTLSNLSGAYQVTVASTGRVLVCVGACP